MAVQPSGSPCLQRAQPFFMVCATGTRSIRASLRHLFCNKKAPHGTNVPYEAIQKWTGESPRRRLRYAAPNLLACLLACLRSLRSRKQANAEYGHKETSGRDAVRTAFCMDACSVFIEKRAKTLKNCHNVSTSYSFSTQNTFLFHAFLAIVLQLHVLSSLPPLRR